MEVLLTYDVDTTTKAGQRRLRQMAKICESFGQRVQFSVFEMLVSDTQYVTLLAAITDTVSHRDNVRIYVLPRGSLGSTRVIGSPRHLPHDAPWIL